MSEKWRICEINQELSTTNAEQATKIAQQASEIEVLKTSLSKVAVVVESMDNIKIQLIEMTEIAKKLSTANAKQATEIEVLKTNLRVGEQCAASESIKR